VPYYSPGSHLGATGMTKAGLQPARFAPDMRPLRPTKTKPRVCRVPYEFLNLHKQVGTALECRVLPGR
jgi:hypothetical protein